MFKNKKILIFIAAIFLILILMVCIVLVIKNKDNSPKVEEKTLENTTSEEELEGNFKNMFYNVKYLNDTEENIVDISFVFEQTEEGKYDIKAHAPRINLETEITKKINDEIINTFGQKIVEIGEKEEEFTLYTVDYLTFENDGILSLIIKGTLKEGSNPQKVFMKTYNYDIENDKVLTLEEVIERKNLDKEKVQSKILDVIRQKNTNSKNVAEQGYNVYVRDIRSDEYLLENVENFFIGDNNVLYIVFAYGNNYDTETYDLVIVNE